MRDRTPAARRGHDDHTGARRPGWYPLGAETERGPAATRPAPVGAGEVRRAI